MQPCQESTTTRKAGDLDFTAKGGKGQGHEVPYSLKTTRWNRGHACEAPGLENPISKTYTVDFMRFDI